MPRALIVGLGLIGGSIGMALRARDWHVAFVDQAVDLDQAIAAGAADEKLEWGAGAPAGDIVILATPVDVAIEQARSLDVDLATSVCSVMQPLRDAATPRTFIAGHPMAGSQEHGLWAAKSDLFEGKRWFVDAKHPLVEQVVRDCGATMTLVDARQHDDAVAATSHLPQLLSTALAAYLNDLDVAAFAGSGLRDFLRLAESHPSVWLPLFSANRGAIDHHLQGVAERAGRIAGGDRQLFFDAFEFLDKLARG